MAAPVNIEPPVLSGTPIRGQILSVTTGTWDVTPDSFTYVWKRGAAVIAGAAAATYTTVQADVGQTITAEVTAVNVDGSSVPAPSNGVGPIAEPAPANTTPPVVTGQAYVNSILSVSNGVWTNNPTSYNYQWYAGSNPITDATDPTYDLTPDELGLNVACQVTAINGTGQGVALSNWVGPVAFRPLTPQEEFAVWLARNSYPKPGPRWHGA